MDQNFEINAKKFKLNKINALKQFHIVRRVGPILSDMLPGLQGAAKYTKPEQLEKLSESEKLAMVAKFATPIMNGLSKLSDEDSEKVLYGLLEAVEMQQVAGNWAKVSNGSMLMLQDLELPVLMQLAGRAFIFNLSGFFAALPQ